MPTSALPILVLNAGSSSLKFSFLLDEQHRRHGVVDRLGVPDVAPHAVTKNAAGKVLAETDLPGRTHEDALDWVLGEALRGEEPPAAVGHRVVHGGDTFSAPVRVTTDVVSQLETLIPLAPLHQPHNLAPMRYLLQRTPALPQVACFDTAFHATQPRLERLYALPRRYLAQGVKRYGFHGLSYEYIASRLPEVDLRAAVGRTVVCHLGNGASLCAMEGCKSVATTMGFTPLDGLVMGTRAGSIDPGVLLYLLQHEHLDPAALSDLLSRESGLLGVSGISSDMRDLLASSAPEAAEAVELFCYRAARELGTFAGILGGLDALVFTGGIGEHAAPVRQRICERVLWLGVQIDPDANAAHEPVLNYDDSRVAVRIIPTDEERMIARHTTRVLGMMAG
jgi:acetate kinase